MFDDSVWRQYRQRVRAEHPSDGGSPRHGLPGRDEVPEAGGAYSSTGSTPSRKAPITAIHVFADTAGAGAAAGLEMLAAEAAVRAGWSVLMRTSSRCGDRMH